MSDRLDRELRDVALALVEESPPPPPFPIGRAAPGRAPRSGRRFTPLVVGVAVAAMLVGVAVGAVVVLGGRADHRTGSVRAGGPTTTAVPGTTKATLEIRPILFVYPAAHSAPGGDVAPIGYEILASRSGPSGPGPRYVVGPAALTGKSVRSAEAVQVPGEGWAVDLTLDQHGSEQFNALAARLFPKRPPENSVAVVVDGVVQSAPALRTSRFEGESIQISDFTEREAKALAASFAPSSAQGHAVAAPCRVLRLDDARGLIGRGARRVPLSGTSRNPACTYSAAKGSDSSPPSIVLHLKREEGAKLTKLRGSLSRSPSLTKVRVRGLDSDAFWLVVYSVQAVPAGSPRATPRIDGGTLMFTVADQLVAIDVHGTGDDLDTAKRAGRIVIGRLA